MHGLKSFVCKLKKKATFPHPSVPDNDVFEEIGVRPIFFEPRIIYFWMVGHAGWRSNGEKKTRKAGGMWLVDEVSLETRRREQAPRIFIFSKINTTVVFFPIENGNTQRETWQATPHGTGMRGGLAATIKPPQCRKNGAYMVINFHFCSTRNAQLGTSLCVDWII